MVAALLVLQARGRVSAAELAMELETSVSTARRDLEALLAAGIPVDRLVDPWGLVRKGEVWYLLSATDGAERTYRVDRITDLVVTDQPAQRPPRGALEEA